ncbi:glycosyltransferase [Kineococcus rhizosphaerae]|uniref:UDP-N-acetylglucosamine transferase subunit ALG13 n=1 Tax=Kineococcus rhizosphaerae TaxID=559628 RepID=A0A2T0R115_9ACTN|nr:glycosyltransferase [Kineococcus rhizosphaerae]PRY12931.1 UDP-N-acetylglucosamine transferase subunit ALG13 [Kineococcus rhizosphaerae]
MTALLVANDGGHLAQLRSLAKRLPIADAFRWVTVPTPQSESLLEGEDVTWVKPAPTRDLRAAVHNAVLASPLFRRGRISAVVSTGSSLAVSVLPQARLHGTPSYYIESATRTDGPSLSGRVLARVPGVELYTQNASWASKKWKYAGSVFDGWEPLHLPEPRKVSKVVVSLGTSRTYGFRRLVEHVAPLLRDLGAEVLWQTGTTDTAGLPVLEPRAAVPAQELSTAMREADLVIAHAGTGVALEALQAGKLPLLIPRRAEFSEHVDDHQEQIAGMLRTRGLAVVREADQVSADDLSLAASRTVDLREDARPLAL